MSDPFDKARGVVSRRRLWLLPFQALPAAAVFALMPLLGSQMLLAWAIGLFACFLLGVGAAVLWYRWVARIEGRLVADANGLHVDGRLVLARTSIRNACVRRNGERLYVRLQRKFQGAVDMDVEVSDEAEAEALLTAMRLRGPLAITRYAAVLGSFRDTMLRAFGVALAATVALGLSHTLWGTHGWFVTIPALLFAVVAASLRWGVSVFVGADGLRFERSFGRSRFIGYASVVEIATDGTTVSIELRDGEKIAFQLGMRGIPERLGRFERGRFEHEDQAHGLVARVRERMTAHRHASVEHVASALARGGRGTAEWMRAVTGATDGAASYRLSAVPADVLLAVVEDETANADTRVGAAVALRHAGLDEKDRERVRVAAEACAAPQLRIALEAAATAEDEDEVLHAIDALPQQAARRA